MLFRARQAVILLLEYYNKEDYFPISYSFYQLKLISNCLVFYVSC